MLFNLLVRDLTPKQILMSINRVDGFGAHNKRCARINQKQRVPVADMREV